MTFISTPTKKLNHSKGFSPIIDANGKLHTDDLDKATVLNIFFLSVGITDDGHQPTCTPPDIDDALCSVIFTPTAVHKAIKLTKNNNNCGPDGFPSILVKNISNALALPLSIIFESFMSVGKTPSAWGNAIITPILKKGLATKSENDRPISLTSIFCKIMKRIIAFDMLNFFLKHKLICKHKHEFLSKSSTTTNLLDSINDWTLVLKNKRNVTIAYVDYSKAFDVVSHPKLLLILTD